MTTRERHLYEFGPYRLDTAEQRLLRNGTPVPLTPKAFEMLVALVERAGNLVHKDELMKAVWPDAFVEESNLTNNIYELRRALGQGENGASFIETVPKRGYRFTAVVQALSADALVVEKRTVTRIVTEEREEAPPRRLHPMLLSALVVGSGLAVYGGYQLIARPSDGGSATPRRAFETLGISRLTTTGNITDTAVSPDGQYVASVVNDDSGNSLWVKNLNAPSNVQIAGPAGTEYISVAFRPGSNSVYYVALDHDKGEATLYRAAVIGGPSNVVAKDVYPIGFSADGQRMAFIRMRRSESTLVVADADASNQRVIATRQKPDSFELEWNAPAWSPDGSVIACPVSLNDDRGHYSTIVGINVSDGTQRLLTDQRWSYAGQAVWLPDSSGLLMTAKERSGGPMQIWHIQSRDGSAAQVTHDLNNYGELGLTRDGSRFVALQSQSVSSIWVTPGADAQSARQIRSEVGSFGDVVWTGDGRVVYPSSAGGNGPDIWTISADGSSAKQVTTAASVAQGLSVTPDGRQVIFSSSVADRFHLWRVDIDGGNLRQLTDGSGEFYPQSTPDGRWVVYQSGLNIDPRLWRVPTEGGQAQQIVDTRAARPTVSPDGRLVAYSYLDIELTPPRWGIGVASVAGGPRLKRFDFPSTVKHRFVRWAPDGQSIAFVNNAGGRSDIWLQPLDGRPATQLTNFGAEQIMAFDWSPDGRSLVFVRHIETSDAVQFRSK